MDVPCGIFRHIIIIKEAALTVLKSLKHKLLTSFESEY